MHCIVLLLLLPLRKKDRPPVSGARYTWTILGLDPDSWRRYKYRSLANLSMTESCYGVNEYLPESIKGIKGK